MQTNTALRLIDATTCTRLLDFPGLIEALKELFAIGVDQLDAYRMEQPIDSSTSNHWIFLPAWQYGRHKGIKIVSVYPQNEKKGIDSVQGLYVLFDATTGLPLLCIDGASLTLRKTAANSALASRYLSRADASTMLMVGAGALAPHLIEAHKCVRNLRRIMVWNRTATRAEALINELAKKGIQAELTTNLQESAFEADIICSATMAKDPLIKGKWLKPGCHLDLVGGYMPDMREADDDAIRNATVFVDTRITTINHAGDICQPIANGLISENDITDSFQLIRGERPGRTSASQRTFFKSGGGGHEDLGTAQYLLSKLN
jgi:alanine dehydrogenase